MPRGVGRVDTGLRSAGFSPGTEHVVEREGAAVKTLVVRPTQGAGDREQRVRRGGGFDRPSSYPSSASETWEPEQRQAMEVDSPSRTVGAVERRGAGVHTELRTERYHAASIDQKVKPSHVKRGLPVQMSPDVEHLPAGVGAGRGVVSRAQGTDQALVDFTESGGNAAVPVHVSELRHAARKVTRTRVGGGYDDGDGSISQPDPEHPRPWVPAAEAGRSKVADRQMVGRTDAQGGGAVKVEYSIIREDKPGDQTEHRAVRRGGGWEDGTGAPVSGWKPSRSHTVHHDGSPRTGSDRPSTTARDEPSLKIGERKDHRFARRDVEEGEYHALVKNTETVSDVTSAGGVRTSIFRPGQRARDRQFSKHREQRGAGRSDGSRVRVGGGYDHDDQRDWSGTSEGAVPPRRHAKNATFKAHQQQKTKRVAMPKQPVQKTPDHRLCRKPFTNEKRLLLFLIMHSVLEGGALLCAFRDWFRCNFYPEYSDLRGDLICGAAVCAAGLFWVASVRGCDCICCNWVRSADKTKTDNRHWPTYLYALCCVLGLCFTVFAAHPTTISDEPFADEMPASGAGTMAGRRAQESAPGTDCTTQDVPIAWCVAITAENIDAGAHARDDCTDVMKYAACGPGMRDESCAEPYPFDTFHQLAVRKALSSTPVCSRRPC